MRILFKTAAITPLAVAAALTAALALAPAAHAAQATVRYADLDLATPAGQAELAARVDQAAITYCTPDAVTGTRITPRADKACVADVRGRINAQLAARGKIARQPAAFASRQP